LFFWRVHEKGAPLTKQAESHDEPIEPSERQASALLNDHGCHQRNGVIHPSRNG
jgi:hypothetical protein